MNTILNIGAAIISPALIISVMVFMINSVNKRIDDMNKRFDDMSKRFDDANNRVDDLKSEMKSDHAKLSNAMGELSSVVLGLDKRLENLNQTTTRHLEFHATNKS